MKMKIRFFRILLFFLVFGAYIPGIRAQQHKKITLSGYVYDAKTRERLLDAEIYAPASGLGTTTNRYGFYSLTLPAVTDSVEIWASFTGYDLRKLKVPAKTSHLDIYLQPGETLSEVVINARGATHQERRAEMSKISLNASELQAVPVILSEPDPIKVLQKLPGIQPGNEGMSGIFVRGGSYDQNLYLLDDVPLYYINHLGGFVSTFNPDAINKVSIYKGDFPARFGNRLSSVLDVRMRDGNKRHWKTYGTIGMLSWKIGTEGPLVRDRTSISLSARRMPYDLLSRAISYLASQGESSGGYTFYDFNVKINHKLTDRDQLSASWYYGDDAVSFSFHSGGDKEKMRTGWGNHMAALRWDRQWTGKWFSSQILSYTRYRLMNRYRSWYDNHLDFDWSYYSGIRDLAFKSNWQYIAGPGSKIYLGAGITHHTFRPGALDLSSIDTDETHQWGNYRIRSMDGFVYGEWKKTWTRRLKTRFGFRLSDYILPGRHYISPEPRISVNYMLNDNTSVKASYARMQQGVHLLTSSGAGMPIDLWMPSIDSVPPSRAWIAAIGAAHTQADGRWEMSLEMYYKRMHDLIHYKPGASYINTAISDWARLVETQGVGNAYGIEWMLRKRTGRLTGWIAYTWAHSTRQFTNLNRGQAFPFRYDRRHVLDIVGVYRISPKLRFSFAWNFSSGLPVTLPVGQMVLPQEIFPAHDPPALEMVQVYSDRNRYRMEPYHRLDLSLDYRVKKTKVEYDWNLSVYNAYNRHNPFFYFVSEYNPVTDREDPGVYKISLFPIIPSIGLSFKF